MYLDPGFGSMIIQVVIAAIATCGVVFMMMKSKIKAFFSKRKNKNAETHEKKTL